jgi:hypothetical protein
MYGPYSAQLVAGGSLTNASFIRKQGATVTPKRSTTRKPYPVNRGPHILSARDRPGERHVAFELELEGLLRVEALGALPTVSDAGLGLNKVCSARNTAKADLGRSRHRCCLDDTQDPDLPMGQKAPPTVRTRP